MCYTDLHRWHCASKYRWYRGEVEKQGGKQEDINHEHLLHPTPHTKIIVKKSPMMFYLNFKGQQKGWDTWAANT